MQLSFMLDVVRESLWSYVGPQKKYLGSTHMVLSVETNNDKTGDEIITWCRVPAISWLGDKADFLKNFKPTTGTFSFI